MKPALLVINYTSDISGSSVALFRLLSSIHERAPFLLVASPESYMSRKAKSCGWEYREVPIPLMVRNLSPVYWMRFIRDCFIASRQTKKLISHVKPKYLLANSSFNLGWIGGWLLVNKQLKPEILWLVHELDIQPAWVFFLLRKFIQRLSKKILCVSKSVEALFKENAYLLPNIIPEAPESAFLNPFQQETLALLWVGTVSPRKGLHVLPSLLPAFRELSLPVTLEIVASVSSKYQKYFAGCVQEISKAGIEVTTRVNSEDGPSWYASSKILLHTSLLPESFNLVSIEAMSRGMLVFASNKGGIADFGVHQQNLIYFEKLQQPLSQYLHTLKNHPELVLEMQSQAHKTARDYYPGKISPLFLDLLS